jgi:transposase-like protein
MGQGKRIRRSAAVWQQLFSRQSSSGLSVAEFCAREGINASLFWRWRSTLKDAGEGHRVAAPAQPAAQVAVPFIDLGDLRSSGSRVEVRLELGAGIVLSIARS